MKNTLVFFLMVIAFAPADAQFRLKAPGVKWDESYSFDKCNSFKIEFYAKNNELMRTQQIKTYYQSNGENFIVKFITDKTGIGMETVIDKTNEVAIQIFGSGGTAKPYYNAGGYKYPAETDLKKLEIAPTTETKTILGFSF